MKDAFGGTFMLKVMLVFFVIIISFLTVAISFAKTFRIKNNVISILEKTEAKGVDQSKNGEIYSQIETYLNGISYSYAEDISDRCSGTNIKGVCIIEKGTETERYYQVTAYIVISYPVFKFKTVVPISGESKTIYEH